MGDTTICTQTICSVDNEPDGKQYILLNANRFFNKTFHGEYFISRIPSEFQYSDWKIQIGIWFVAAIEAAEVKKSQSADITAMFTHGLHYQRLRINQSLSAEKVREYLINPLGNDKQKSSSRFTIQSEKDGIVYLAAPATW